MIHMNPKQTQKRIIFVLIGVLAVAIVAMIVALCQPQRMEFVPPTFDGTAVQGVPEVEDALVWRELYQEGMAYRIFVCWVPAAQGRELTVYFTNPSDNTKNLKLRVFDESGKVLGETGLIRPGEYVKSVTLDRELSAGTKIRLKAMGYEPETYESAGAFSMNFTVQ